MATRDRRRPRQVLLLALVIVAAAQLALTLLLDHGVPLLRFADARAIMKRLEERSVNPDVVLLGSSRFHEGGRDDEATRILDRVSVLNAAVFGGDHTSHERILGHLLDAGASPR